MGGGRGSSTTTTAVIPEELTPYARALGEQLSAVIGKYPLDFLFQYRPMPILPPSPEEMYLRNVIMGLPFGGQLPTGMTSYQGNMPYGNIFLTPDTTMKVLPPIEQPPEQPILQQPNQPLTSSGIQDWLLTQQLAEIFGANHAAGWFVMPKENSPLYNAWIKGIDNILEQTGLPVNDYTRNIAKQAIKLAKEKWQQMGS